VLGALRLLRIAVAEINPLEIPAQRQLPRQLLAETGIGARDEDCLSGGACGACVWRPAPSRHGTHAQPLAFSTDFASTRSDGRCSAGGAVRSGAQSGQPFSSATGQRL
jgi:hypothetical protein